MNPPDTRDRAIAIGVTGHRDLADAASIETGIVEALGRIRRAHEGGRLVVLSALAEGADRLVARLARRDFDARLVAVLPLPRSEYAHDFPTAESRRAYDELLGDADEIVELPFRWNREEAYEAAGRLVLARSDVLLAVWDGRPPRGPGGTGAIVELARERGVPLAWVHTGDEVRVGAAPAVEASGRSPTGDDDAAAAAPVAAADGRPGEVRFEGFGG